MTTVEEPNLSEQKFHNWIKQGIALVLTKKGLQDIVENEIKQFQQKTYANICKNKGIPQNNLCKSCSTENIVKCSQKNKVCRYKNHLCQNTHKPCPSNMCDKMRDEIIKVHRYSGPSWKNTDAAKWASSPWEIAKCFMPPEGYKPVSSATDTDFNGIISVIINYEDFQANFQENLSNKSNIFYQARDIGKSYRHGNSYEVSEKDFKHSISILTSLFKDPKYIASDKKAQAALHRLQQLSSESWKILDTEMAKDLQDALNEAKESIDRSKLQFLEQTRSFIETYTKKDLHGLLDQLQLIFSQHKKDIEVVVQQGIKRIRRESEDNIIYKRQRLESGDDYDIQKEELRQRLFRAYKHQCSSLPISALLEEEELPLLTFYVQPYMRRVEHHRVQKEEISIDSCEGIFVKDAVRCNDIYVTGDAGIGKTVMCRRMVLLWCLIHQTKIDTLDESVLEDSKTMEYFDFLFYISLRDTSCCRIEDIIQHQILGLSSSKDLLMRILRTEKCLVILDGLDEWSHPLNTEHCPSNLKIPHREHFENCVFLTTSRPYKLEQLRLETHDIDLQIEIRGMKEGVGFEFVELLVNLLNEKCSQTKDPTVFLEDVANSKLDDLLNVPLITTHLICLWFDEKLRKMSVSEVYANTLEMMFMRASQRKSRSATTQTSITEQEESKLKPPNLMANLEHIQKNIAVLYKLSYLAFDTLFTEHESSLVFSDSDLVRYGISEETVTYLCSVGILSKSKAIGFLTERKHTLSFPHKLYQEFMAALYISMSAHDESRISSTMLKACKCLADVKKFSDVFIFLASLAPCAVETLFQRVNAVLSKDKTVSDYREYSCYAIFSFISQRRKQVENMVKSLQDLAVSCFDECKRSGRKNIDFKLEDIFVYKSNVSQIQTMLQSSNSCVKSVFISGSYLEEEHCLLSGLVRLEIRYIDSNKDFKMYSKMMSTSCTTLKNVSICYCQQISELPVERLARLTSLCFNNVKVEHNHLSKLVDFISKKYDLSQIVLEEVECEDHEYDCSLGNIDLRNHKNLYLLGIGRVNFEAVQVNNSALFRLKGDFRETQKAEEICWAEPFLKSLMSASKLKKVVISNILNQNIVSALSLMLPSLQSVKYIYLLNIDFGEHILWLDPEGVDVDIELSHVTLTSDSFSDFVDSVAKRKNSACVNMLFYTINPSRSDVLELVKSNERFQIVRETDYSFKFRTKAVCVLDSSA